jgi:hypothetical protein
MPAARVTFLLFPRVCFTQADVNIQSTPQMPSLGNEAFPKTPLHPPLLGGTAIYSFPVAIK